MPTYEYKCEKCGKEFEEFQSMTAEAKANCPECGAEAKRMIEESLIQDDRILEVSNFKFEFGIRSCSISFNVQSIFGNYRESMEVPA